MCTATKILREYETAFRDLVTFKNWSTNQSVKEALRLNKGQDWSFICTALDVIGDATLAIKNFMEYGLEGATDGNDDGEKYLRLYGVLNSAYLQQEAIYNLYKLSNVSDPKTIKEKIKKLKIFEIRNKIGAHSNDYIVDKTQAGQILESYIPIRSSLMGHKFVYVNSERSTEDIGVDLIECLNEHLILIIDLLDKTYEKSIKTIYKGDHKNRQMLLDSLSDLRKFKPAT